MIYKWSSGSRINVDAQLAGEELERIRTVHNGRLESPMVVEAARNQESPLHPAFEWDDQKAATSWRLEQAGNIIRHLVVEIGESEPSKPVRAFVSVVRDQDRSYTSVAHAMADPELRRQVLLNALRELEAWRDRYSELVELAQVFSAIEDNRHLVDSPID